MSNELENIYLSFKDNVEPLDFFNGLGRYTTYIYDNPKLKKVFEGQINERNKRYRIIEKLEQRSLEEMRAIEKYLKSIIKSKKINTDIFKRYISFPFHDEVNFFQSLENFNNGKVNLNGFTSDALNSFLYDIVINLKNLGYKKHIKKFMVNDIEYQKYYSKMNSSNIVIKNEYGNYVFSKSWPERIKELTILNNERVFKSWGYFEKINNFNVAYNCMINDIDYWSDVGNGEIKVKFDMRLEAFNLINICEIIEDLKIVKDNDRYHINIYRENANKKFKKLNVDIYRNTINVVHSILLKSIDKKENENNYENSNEIINIKNLDILIKNGEISKRNGSKKTLTKNERKLIYFLYYKYVNNPEECFNLKKISENAKITETSIRNTILSIHKKIKKLMPPEFSKKILFIKNEPKKRGYKFNQEYQIS
jgi:hypothetical protein